MAKQSVQLNDFSGGINKSSAARDIEGNESTEIKNFSVERPGIIQLSPISRESDKYDTSIISESKHEKEILAGTHNFRGQAQNNEFITAIGYDNHSFEGVDKIALLKYDQFKSPHALGNRANPNFNKKIMGRAASTMCGELIKADVNSHMDPGGPNNWAAYNIPGGNHNHDTSDDHMEITNTTDNEAEGSQLARSYIYRQTFGLATPSVDDTTFQAGDVFRVSAKVWFDTSADTSIPFYFKIGGTQSRAFYVDGTSKSDVYIRDIVAADNGGLYIYNITTTAKDWYFTDVTVKKVNKDAIVGPHVNWGIGNEFPRFARSLTSSHPDAEWARWEYENADTFPIVTGEFFDLVSLVTSSKPHTDYMKIKLRNLMSGPGRGYSSDTLYYSDAGFNIQPDTWYVIKLKYRSSISSGSVHDEFGLAAGDGLNDWWLDRNKTDEYGQFKFDMVRTFDKNGKTSITQIRIKTKENYSPSVPSNPAITDSDYPGQIDEYDILDNYIYFNNSIITNTAGAFTEGNGSKSTSGTYLIWMSIEPDLNQTDIYQSDKNGDEYIYGLLSNQTPLNPRYRDTLYSVRDNAWDVMPCISNDTPPVISLNDRNNSVSEEIPPGLSEWSTDGYTSALRYFINPDCNGTELQPPSYGTNKPSVLTYINQDSYFIDGALRSIDTNSGNLASGSWYGYISKEMYGGLTQVREKSSWMNVHSWMETGWFSLSRWFAPPTIGTSYVTAANVANSSDGDKYATIPNSTSTGNETAMVRAEYLGTDNTDTGTQHGHNSHWFQHSKIANKNDLSSMTSIPVNGHDLFISISTNIDSDSDVVASAEDSLDPAFAHKWNLGVSYLYDGTASIDYSQNTMQETSITPVTWAPVAEVLGTETAVIDWSSGVVRVQGIRVQWQHGSRYFRANPRLSGFCVYMRKDISEGDDNAQWGMLFEVNFLTGQYKYYGSEAISENAILGLRQTTDANTGDYNNPAHTNDYGTGYEYIDSDNAYHYTIYDEMFTTSYHKMPFVPGSAVTYNTRNGYASEDLKRLKWKTSVIGGNRLYIGNVSVLNDDSTSIVESHPDRVIMSPAYKFDTLPITNWQEVGSVGVGDEIISLEYYKGDLVVFKKNKVIVIDGDLESGLEVKHEMSNNGIRLKSQTTSVMDGICWVNNQGLFKFDGEKLSNIIEKTVTVAGTSLDIKRFSLDEWAKYDWDTQNAFLIYDAKLNQLIIGNSNQRVDDETIQDDIKRQFIYDFTTKSMTMLKGVFGEHDESFSVPINSYENHLRFQVEDGSWYYWDTNRRSTIHDEATLITKDIDLQDPGRRKKFYKVYITFKSSLFPDLEDYEDIESKPFLYSPSNVKVYYALNGTQQWQEFDTSLSTNYDSNGLTGIENNFLGSLTLNSYNAGVSGGGDDEFNTGDYFFSFSSDVSSSVKAGYGFKINSAVYPIISLSSDGTDCYIYNSDASGGVVEGTSSGTPSNSDTVEIISNDWIRAELKPKTTDTDKNNFKSIQFKVEGNGSVIPSNFAINDITMVYREKPIN